MNDEYDRTQVQQRAILADKIEVEPRVEYLWLQALGDLIAKANELQESIKDELLRSEIAPDATVWNPEEFNEIKRSIQAQSELVEGGAGSGTPQLFAFACLLAYQSQRSRNDSSWAQYVCHHSRSRPLYYERRLHMGVRKTISLKKLDEIETHCNDVSLYHFGARRLFNELIAEVRWLRKVILRLQKEMRADARKWRKLHKLGIIDPMKDY